MTKSQPDLFDIPPSFGTEPHKLHRRDGPETSRDAAYSIETTRLEKMVLDVIRAFGPRGCIADDVRHELTYLSYSSVTARFSALQNKELITCGPDKRPGESGRQQRVMRAGFLP